MLVAVSAAAELMTLEAFAAALSGPGAGGASVPREGGGAGGTRVIAIDGWSGSGKTALADRLAPVVGSPSVHLDDWVPGWSGLARSVELLVDWVLRPLAEGRPARWRRWDWHAGCFGAAEVLAPADLVIVEGCGAGSAPARPWLSMSVWLSVAEEERQRRLHARPDWPVYAPWADMWAQQERALRGGEDPLATADAVVQPGPDPDGPLRVAWS